MYIPTGIGIHARTIRRYRNAYTDYTRMCMCVWIIESVSVFNTHAHTHTHTKSTLGTYVRLFRRDQCRYRARRVSFYFHHERAYSRGAAILVFRKILFREFFSRLCVPLKIARNTICATSVVRTYICMYVSCKESLLNRFLSNSHFIWRARFM